MRPGQNKRMRGRNGGGGGGRKGPNPLTRSYELNGPDVKIRGTAQHIGEKYLQLARDAQTSGDPVAAESYLQHAEHYFRLIAAAQQAQFQAQSGFVRQAGDTDGDDNEDDDDLNVPDRFALPSERMHQPQPQPPHNPPLGERPGGQPYAERPERQDRPERPDRPEGQDRPYRQDRYNNGERDGQRGFQDRAGQPNYDRQDRPNYDRNPRNDRNDRNRNRFNRDGNEPRDNNRDRDGNRDGRDMQYREQPRMPQPREPGEQRLQQPAPQPAEAGSDLPAFITAPVRAVSPAPAPEPVAVPAAMNEGPETTPEATGEPSALRPRRRRRARVVTAGDVELSSDGGNDGSSGD